MPKKLNIKNMVCDRCIMSVSEILDKNGIQIKSIKLGEVVLKDDIDEKKLEIIDSELQEIGFELLTDEKLKIIEKIKNEIINLIYKESDKLEDIRISDFLIKRLNKDYSSLSNLFSKTTGITIEKYFILQKIERAKELLTYEEYNVSEIAFLLGYKNSQHFSSQFKKITGISPSRFKNELPPRKPLDKI